MDLLLVEKINELEGAVNALSKRLDKLEKKKVKVPFDAKPYLELINSLHNDRYGCTISISSMIMRTIKNLSAKASSKDELMEVLEYYYLFVNDRFIIQKAHDLVYLYTNYQKYLTEVKTGQVIDYNTESRRNEIKKALGKL